MAVELWIPQAIESDPTASGKIGESIIISYASPLFLIIVPTSMLDSL